MDKLYPGISTTAWNGYYPKDDRFERISLLGDPR